MFFTLTRGDTEELSATLDHICFMRLSKREQYRDHLPKRVIVNGRAVVCYWPDVMDDVTVEYQGVREKVKKPAHEPVNHDAPKRPYQRGMSYSDDEKLAALEMMEHMPVTQVSKKTGISPSCLYRWREMFRGSNG